jgi:hypothetical protein
MTTGRDRVGKSDDLKRAVPPVKRPLQRKVSAGQALNVRDADMIDALRHGVDRGVQRFAPSASPNPDPNARMIEEDRKKLVDAAHNQPPPPPPVTIPGDHGQQDRLIDVDPSELWSRADVQARVTKLAQDTEAREAALHPDGKITHTAAAMMDYWRVRFAESVEYILTIRPRGSVPARDGFRHQLAQEEAKIVAAGAPLDQQIVAVEAARAKIKQKWDAEVERAVTGYLIEAESESLLVTRDHAPKPAVVLGLPLGLEPERTAESARAQIETGSAPVAESVVEFMVAVQAAAKDNSVKASNYANHEQANPHFENDSIGKYSFDVDLPFKHNSDGFYDRQETIKFFRDLESLAVDLKIEWFALYNDARVIIEVNDHLPHARVGFSGGGNHGQFHHGPDPYILHVHFNIMPTKLRDQYLVGKQMKDVVAKFEAFLKSLDARF